MTDYFTHHETAAKKIIQHIGKSIVIGVPLGLGKPVGLLNALYQLACDDSSIQLTILTGLTLARPTLHNPLEKTFLKPILDRLLQNYEDPLYEKARVLQQLPRNIKVIEFFLSPGKFLNNAYVQQNFISSNYSNVIRDVINLSINVFAQQVAPSANEKDLYSLSSNTDVFHSAKDYLIESAKQGKKTAIVAEVNANLPFMMGEMAEVKSSVFTDIIDTKKYPALFSMPREALGVQDHYIGLYTSCLIKDDGCLQVGIGNLSLALANALIFRHQKNDDYKRLLKKLNVNNVVLKAGDDNPFIEGLYASTEMLSDEYMQLLQAGILKKRVYDHVGLQQLLNSKKISETITPDILDTLIDYQIIHSILTIDDVIFLKKFGIFKDDIQFENNQLILGNGESASSDLSNTESKNKIIKDCLAKNLISGKIIHAGFFLGSIDLYHQLHQLSQKELQKIEMVSIARTNTLLFSPELLSLQRKRARFVNSSLMVTLLGGIVSDSLMNYQEVSGVGGQYDFVSQANQLQGAYSIINCRSTRKTKAGIKSNIVWDYPNATISRYLRDIIVTEYGIADCRSKTDEEVIKAILNITDSRFQMNLLNKAKKSGKLSIDYQIPALFRHNFPENLKEHNFGTLYPFGSDLTVDEETLARILLFLKNCSRLKLLTLMISAFFFSKRDAGFDKFLVRMNLKHPKTTQDYLYQKLFIYLIATDQKNKIQ